MKILKGSIIAAAFIILLIGIYYSMFVIKKTNVKLQTINTQSLLTPTVNAPEKENRNEDIPQVAVIAEGLDIPWALAFLPQGGLLISERKGRVRYISIDGYLQNTVLTVPNVKEIGEGGLLGMALHPDFLRNKRVYVYYTYAGNGNQTLNRVSYFTYREYLSLDDEKIIVDAIPGAPNHNGGRIKFGPDKKLYITTGDAQNPSLSQDKNSYAGKILRVNDDGSTPEGNPFNNATYSYGHRNPQGIAWDRDGQLWETEHGPSGLETGNDEFNKIMIGGNYGWPEIRGKQAKDGMNSPVIESGFLNTWAPGGLAYLYVDSLGSNGKFYFTGLKGSSLFEVDEKTFELKQYFKNDFGRLREVIVGPDNMLYVTTSNRDGRGKPKDKDDVIIRINPAKL